MEWNGGGDEAARKTHPRKADRPEPTQHPISEERSTPPENSKMRAPKKQRVGRENERRHLFLSLSLGTLLFEPCNLDVWYTATKLDVKFSFPPSAEVRRRRSYGITEFPPPPTVCTPQSPFLSLRDKKGPK